MRRILRRLLGQIRPGDDVGMILRGAMTMLTVQGGGAVVGYVVMIALSRWMGAAEFGVYVFAISWGTILAIPAGLGLPIANVRFISQYLATEDYGKLRGLVARSRGITVMFGTALSAGAVGVVLLAEQVIAPYYVWPLCISLIAVPFVAWLNLEVQIARGFGWIGLAFAPRDIARPALLIAFLGIMWILGFAMTAICVTGVAALSYIAVVVIQRCLVGRRMANTIPSASLHFDTRQWLTTGLPFLLINGFQTIMLQSDVVMVGMFLAPEDVAIYQAAARTSGLVMFVSTAISARTAGSIATLHTLNRRDELQSLLSRLIHWIFWPSLLSAILVIGFGKILLILFGANYVAGYPVLIVLTIGIVLHAAAGPVGLLLNMTGNQGLCARVFGASALINILLNALLIPNFGIVGAALSTAATMLLWNLWLLIIVAQKLDLQPSLIHIPKLRRL